MSKNSPAESENSGPTMAVGQDTARGGGQFGGADLTEDRYAYLGAPSAPTSDPRPIRRPARKSPASSGWNRTPTS